MIAVLVIGGFAYFWQNQAIVTDTTTITTSQPTSTANDQLVAQENARYLAYSPEAFSQSSDDRRVLFFYANWCPTCQPVDKNLQENQDQLPEDVTVIRVNYNDTETSDEEKELAKQYGITYQHTFVQIDSSGQEVSKWNGGDIEQLLSNLQ